MHAFYEHKKIWALYRVSFLPFLPHAYPIPSNPSMPSTNPSILSHPAFYYVHKILQHYTKVENMSRLLFRFAFSSEGWHRMGEG
jgi:hypothetical protein